ncbi:hypothetical protein ACFY36_46605 [Actinoplanes sp. NPDC000266]
MALSLNALELDIVRMLRRSAEPLSGRQVADIAGVAPNTANRVLKVLQSRALVRSTKAGRAILWTTTANVAELKELEGSPQERIALVVTAVELEHTEVGNRLLNTERVRIGDIWMVRGEVIGNHVSWIVYLARAGMGNATSAALVGIAARDLHANLVAFVGTAGGLKPTDHGHLDVVVGSRIHNPYVGKQVPTEFGSKLLGRDKTYVVPAPLINVVNACIADSEWTPSSRSRHYNAKHAHAYVAPIVSVEAVQHDPDGPIIQEIRSRFQDAAALDMESFGLAAGADIHDLPVLAVRGLSDFIGDKAKAGNDDLQPRAAGNAASLFRDILTFAHPDDFKRGGTTPPTEPTDDQKDSVAVSLPGGVQIWMDRLGRRSPARANAAKSALAEIRRAGAAATWLNRALHRPPAWLREDDTGDGWALVSSLASIAGSTVAWRGYDQAASAARLTGDLGASAYFTLTARLERLGREPDEDNTDDEPNSRAMDDFGDDVVARVGSVIEFFRAVLGGDLAVTKARAEAAIASLGLVDTSGVLRAPKEPVAQVELDQELRDVTATLVLRQFAQMMLTPGAADRLGVPSGLGVRQSRGNPVTRDLADDGLRLAQWALALRPESEGTRLAHAQAMLGVLVSASGRTSTDVEDEISKRAKIVEIDALQVRENLRDWGGSSGPALAIAARARSIQGDFSGAMRLLLPAPDGVASQREAKHPDVVRFGAVIARAAGDDELALALAAKNPDRVEGELMRAEVLGGHPQMASEAKEALFAALEHSVGRHHSDFQALMALARRFNSLKENEQGIVMRHIESLGQIDPQLADVMRARVLLSQGDPEGALQFVRLEHNELALDAHADALIASGRAEEAARLVLDEGMSRGDIPLVTMALEIAMNNGLAETARNIALTLLGRDDARPIRLKALRALRQLARNGKIWRDVAIRTEEVIDESTLNGLPVPEVEYWLLAEALFFMEKFDKALTVLLRAPALSFNQREKAQLFLTILHSAIQELRSSKDAAASPTVSRLSDPKIYAMFMRAAADWANDEQIAAAAMSIVLMAPDSALTETQIAEFRLYLENYFERHGENASITQIKVEDDNLDLLYEFLRRGEARQQALEELSSEVRAGRVPLVILTEAAGRTCTESLIRRDLGYIMAVDDDSGEETARETLGRRAVIDTTALVVARWTGYTFKKLAARLDSVIVPAPVREDITRARSSLSMRSTATLGWDTRRQHPFVSETTPEEAQAHSEAAEQVWADVQGLQVAPVTADTRRDRWLSAITVAQEIGIPVWADDVVIRRLARALGVPAFGSLDLIRAFADEDGVNAATVSLRENKVVDIPISEPWHALAKNARWKVDSPLALAISRPAAWRDIPKSFDEFRSLMRRRPNDMDAQQTAIWAYQAAEGLARATIPPARPKVVSALLAWVILFIDPFFAAVRGGGAAANAAVSEEAGRITELVIKAAEEIGDRHYPAADALEPLVDILCRGLLNSAGPEATSRIIAALVAQLSDEVGSRVFAAYIQSAGK